MGINQAIYTSSAKGISKGGGMGIHTYNNTCSETELSEFELSYCQYYFAGDVEEISALPTKYVYGKIQNGRYMAAEVTYIGKDYNKESGRMGNFISHMHSFEKEDLTIYPMQMYGSSDFLTAIDNADVDGTNEVDYLPTIKEAQSGDFVSVEVIQEFLGETDEKGEDRMDMFCNLLAAVLKRDEIHKVIIYDTHENILKWIASVEYALPLKCAREISFSSYEKDPTMAEFDIRGAVLGMSQGSPEEYGQTDQFYVFDGIYKNYSKFDVNSDFYQFGICMGMIAYEALQEFHKFLQAYAYEKADNDICNGYKLFQLVQGGISSLEGSEFLDAMKFEGKYGNKKSYFDILEQLTDRMETDQAPTSEFLENLQKLIEDFYKFELTEEELYHILKLSLSLDDYLKKSGADIEKNDRMWNQISRILAKYQKEKLIYVMKALSSRKAFRRLGMLQAYVISVVKKDNLERFIRKFFIDYWATAENEELKYYDPVIQEAVGVYHTLEEKEERYQCALNLFLLVQEMGDGNIYGKGCSGLLQLIDQETDLVEKKQFLLNLRKKEDVTLETRRTKCAFEAFNYVQRSRENISIARIRLQHLGNCIAKSCEDEVSMIKSNPLKIYEKYPVEVTDVSDQELQVYFEHLAALISVAEIEQSEYKMLFGFWKLTNSQKELLIAVLAEGEFEYFKKKKSLAGLEAIFGAAVELGDEGYNAAFKSYVSSMKGSFKEKVTEAMEFEKNKDICDFWKQISKEDKNSKKSFFSFGKWNL